jgi:hypothetical protein
VKVKGKKGKKGKEKGKIGLKEGKYMSNEIFSFWIYEYTETHFRLGLIFRRR